MTNSIYRLFFIDPRLNHIINHQVFGAAPTEIIYMIAMHYILGFDKSIERKTALELQQMYPNFKLKDTAELAKEEKLSAWVENSFGEML